MSIKVFTKIAKQACVCDIQCLLFCISLSSLSLAFSVCVYVRLCLADTIGGDRPKGEQTASVPRGCAASHRLFPPCVCGFSL